MGFPLDFKTAYRIFKCRSQKHLVALKVKNHITFSFLYPFILDSPIYMSWPHFLHGEKHLVEGVHGLHPDPEKHSFTLDLNPVSRKCLIIYGKFWNLCWTQ